MSAADMPGAPTASYPGAVAAPCLASSTCTRSLRTSPAVGALTKPGGTAVADVAVGAVAVSPSGKPRPGRLPKRGDAFNGTLAEFDEPGDWKIIVKAARPGDAAPLERTARFTVFRQDLELANPRANPLLMRQLAEATAGGVRSPEELADIFDEIGSTPAAFETLEQWSYTPWDKWPMFLLMAGCLCAEWALRKRWGLV